MFEFLMCVAMLPVEFVMERLRRRKVRRSIAYARAAIAAGSVKEQDVPTVERIIAEAEASLPRRS